MTDLDPKDQELVYEMHVRAGELAVRAADALMRLTEDGREDLVADIEVVVRSIIEAAVEESRAETHLSLVRMLESLAQVMRIRSQAELSGILSAMEDIRPWLFVSSHDPWECPDDCVFHSKARALDEAIATLRQQLGVDPPPAENEGDGCAIERTHQWRPKRGYVDHYICDACGEQPSGHPASESSGCPGAPRTGNPPSRSTPETEKA